MKKASSILLSIAGLMIVIGTVLFIVSLTQGAEFSTVVFGKVGNTVTKTYNEFEDIRNINVDIDFASLKVKTGDTYKVVIRSNTNQVFKVGEGNQTLTIQEESGKRSFWGFHVGKLITSIELYIPSDSQLDTVMIQSDAGTVEVEALAADSVELNTDAGKIEAKNIETKELIVEVNAGTVDVKGIVDGDSSINCDVGSVVLALVGNEEDYQVKGSVDLGSFRFNGKSYDGIDKVVNIGNGHNQIYVNCEVGSVKINVE